MSKTLRHTKQEEKDLYQKCIELNKQLIAKNKMPVRESEIAHFVLNECVKHVQVNNSGELYINL